jgi:hypothetical protein
MKNRKNEKQYQTHKNSKKQFLEKNNHQSQQ